MPVESLRTLLRARDYAALEPELAAAALPALAKAWPALEPMEKLVAFKLLGAARALELYALLPFAERYFLLGGFPLQSIAPVLEGLGPLERRRFVQLPRDFYDQMFRRLVDDTAVAP